MGLSKYLIHEGADVNMKAKVYMYNIAKGVKRELLPLFSASSKYLHLEIQIPICATTPVKHNIS
jgi:hypothetical protein